MFITVGRKSIAIGPRIRLAASTCLALLLHVFLFWGLLVMRPHPLNLYYDEDYQPPIDVQLYEIVEPPPPVIHVTPPKVEDTPRPDRQAEEAPPAPPTPKPSPAPAPAPQIVAKTVQQQEVVLQKQTVTKLRPQDLSQTNVTVADVSPVPSPSPRKKKQEEEEALKAAGGVKSLADLDLHQVSNVPADVTRSGLSSGAPESGAPANGNPYNLPTAGQLSGALNAGNQSPNGTGIKGGRGKLTQAMQNHDYCNTTVEKGKATPANCEMAGLSGQRYLGLKKDAGLQKAAADRDANLKYKTTAGNSDYWDRVQGGGVSPKWQPEDTKTKGAYSNDKDQRVMNGYNGDPKSGQ